MARSGRRRKGGPLRTRIDFSRLAAGLARPGNDPRSWVAMARVDEDEDATVWDAELGWLVDVTIVGGPLDGEGPVLCRMPASGQGVAAGEYHPPRQGCLVIVAIPNGDPNDDCIVIGQLHDDGCRAASQVNGVDITEAFAARTHILAFPSEDLDAAFENVRITGQMTLGAPDADQPFPRGNDLADAIDRLTDALSAFLDAAATPPGPFGAVSAATFNTAGVILKTELELVKAAKDAWLSTRIRGT